MRMSIKDQLKPIASKIYSRVVATEGRMVKRPQFVCETPGRCANPRYCLDDACHDAWAMAHYERRRPHPLKPFRPLIVTPKASIKREGELVAFLGPQLCFFERDAPRPEIGKPVEVMMARPLYRTKPDGMRDYSNVHAVLLVPVDHDKHAVIQHTGFETGGGIGGGGCTASTRYPGPQDIGPWLTPGRCHIYEAGNANAGVTWKQRYQKLRPGWVFVDRQELESGKFPLRPLGFSDPEEAMYFPYMKKKEPKSA